MKPQIEVLLRDQDLLAVNKPAGVSIHNAEDDFNLMDLLQSQLSIKELFPVHRLDKETSGIQLFAMSSKSASYFATEFQNQNTTKIYIGIVRGQMKTQNGTWAQPLTDKSEGRKNPQGQSAQRIPCKTTFEVLQGSKFFTQCRFHLHTGRQHQIRKHAAINGHHLVGDERYGDSKYNQKMAQLYQTERMFLHCQDLHILGRKLHAVPPCEFDRLFKTIE